MAEPPVSLPGALRGQALLNVPLLNKDTAFTREERAALGLEGLLPSKVATIEDQVAQAYEAITRKTDPLEKYIGLLAIQDRNEHLFYRLLIEHIEEFLPIVYTPIVGSACEQYSHIYRRPRGIWITPEHRGRIADVLATARPTDTRLIVVTDNERILGLGDVGAGGIGIPVGKLTLYTAAAGIHPSLTLPISLDVGTDNDALLADPFYVGWPQPRLRGEAYFQLVAEFVEAVVEVFPDALLQWEDFKKQTAFTLLDRYVDVLPSFNDDIQGTGAVAAAAVMSASRLTVTPLRRQSVLIVGAGAAGIGIARQIRELLEREGLEGADLIRAVAVLDSHGIIHDGRPLREPTKREVAWPVELARSEGVAANEDRSLAQIIELLQPSVLIGASGRPGIFTEEVVRAMLKAVKRPVILPLSNPTSKCEAHPHDLTRWSDGNAIIATGSPFGPDSWRGRKVAVGQANNLYIFPGVGLGVLVSGATRVSGGLFHAAADALALEVSPADLEAGLLFPPLSKIREVTTKVAQSVMATAIQEGIAPSTSSGSIEEAIAGAVWNPEYSSYL